MDEKFSPIVLKTFLCLFICVTDRHDACRLALLDGRPYQSAGLVWALRRDSGQAPRVGPPSSASCPSNLMRPGGAYVCMVRLEERLSFGSSRREKPLCWDLLPSHKGWALRDPSSERGALQDAASNKLACRGESRLLS